MPALERRGRAKRHGSAPIRNLPAAGRHITKLDVTLHTDSLLPEQRGARANQSSRPWLLADRSHFWKSVRANPHLIRHRVAHASPCGDVIERVLRGTSIPIHAADRNKCTPQAHRAGLPRTKRRARARSLRGPLLDGVASSRDLGQYGVRVPGAGTGPHKKKPRRRRCPRSGTSCSSCSSGWVSGARGAARGWFMILHRLN